MPPKRKEEPVYEKLGPHDCMIISKSDRDLLVAINERGKVRLRRVPIPN